MINSQPFSLIFGTNSLFPRSSDDDCVGLSWFFPSPKIIILIKVAPVPGIPLSLMKTMTWIPLPISSFVFKSKIKSYGKLPVLGSTLQSIKRGKNTEIDYLNGEIVKLGKKNGIPTPVNSLIVELVHQTETTGKFLTIDKLTKQLS